MISRSKAKIEWSEFRCVKLSYIKARVYFTFRIPFRLAHSHVRTAFKVYSTVDECGWTSSTHAQYHLLACAAVHEPSWWRKWRNADGARTAEYTLASRHLRKRKNANGLKEHANSLYDSRWRLWPQFSVPLVTAVNKAALRCAYEHGGKRKGKCHLKFSEESSLQILIHINPLPPIHYLYFSSFISSIVNSDLALPATVFSLFVFVFCVSVLC